MASPTASGEPRAGGTTPTAAAPNSAASTPWPSPSASSRSPRQERTGPPRAEEVPRTAETSPRLAPKSPPDPAERLSTAGTASNRRTAHDQETQEPSGAGRTARHGGTERDRRAAGGRAEPNAPAGAAGRGSASGRGDVAIDDRVDGPGMSARRDGGAGCTAPPTPQPQPTVPRHQPVPPRPQPVPPRHQIVIVASADVVTGKDPQGRCEIPGIGPIPQSELERLACDAELFRRAVLRRRRSAVARTRRAHRPPTRSAAHCSPGMASVCFVPTSRPAANPTTSSRGPNPAKAPPTSIIWPSCAAPATVACTTANASSPGTRTASGAPPPTPATPAGGDTPAPTTPTPPLDRAPEPDPAERRPPDSGLRLNDYWQQIRCPGSPPTGEGGDAEDAEDAGGRVANSTHQRAGTPGDGTGAISPDAPPTATDGPATATDHAVVSDHAPLIGVTPLE